MKVPTGSSLVLIVDDDDDCRRIFRAALEFAGHSVLTAHDGNEGIRLAKEHEPDVILMDIAMPETDGIEALRELRASRLTHDIPILAVTAHAASHEINDFLQLGFDELLFKPIHPVDVVAAVNRRVLEGDRPDELTP